MVCGFADSWFLTGLGYTQDLCSAGGIEHVVRFFFLHHLVLGVVYLLLLMLLVPDIFSLSGSPHALPAWLGELTAKTFEACALNRGLDAEQTSYTVKSHPLPLTATEVQQ